MNEVALIAGITGQNDVHSDFLLNMGYVVHGIKRRAFLFNSDRAITL